MPCMLRCGGYRAFYVALDVLIMPVIVLEVRELLLDDRMRTDDPGGGLYLRFNRARLLEVSIFKIR